MIVRCPHCASPVQLPTPTGLTPVQSKLLRFIYGHVTSIAGIIKAAGGRDKVARELNLTPWAIDKWAKSGIPEKHWSTIQRLAQERVSLADLYAANAAVRSAQQAA